MIQTTIFFFFYFAWLQSIVDVSCEVGAQSEADRQTASAVDGSNFACNAYLLRHMDIVGNANGWSGKNLILNSTENWSEKLKK